MAKRCYGCMKMKTQVPLCEHCGYNEHIDNLPHQLPVGTVLKDQYVIGKVLGQGGFGITYLAWDQVLGTAVALKEFFPNGNVSRESSRTHAVSSTGRGGRESFLHSRKRFLQEARTLARLGSIPGIVRVNNLFEDNGTAYIAMEYVEGTNLRNFVQLSGGKLTVEKTLSLLEPVMDALKKVHSAGLVHRDISPDNIMIRPDGSAKLLDFGAVRDIGDLQPGQELPQSTEAVLKHGFAPVEQYQNRSVLGAWTDVYALCGTIYYCLTGQVPPDALSRMVDGARLNWHEIPGLSSRRATALDRGMALLVNDRLASVDELSIQLYQKETTEMTEAEVRDVIPNAIPDAIPAVPAGSRKKSSWLPWIAVAAVVLAIAAVAGGNKKPLPEASTATQPEAVYSENAWRSNVLMADPLPEQSDMVALAEYPAFGTDIPRGKIGKIYFLNSRKDMPTRHWELSGKERGSVVGWFVWAESEKHYELYIAANGGVAAPEDCRELFCGYSNLKTIVFDDNFHMENVQDMTRMFAGCKNLEVLDLSSFETGSVQSMAEMFQGCEALTKLDLSGFDTAKVTDMSRMLAGCQQLEDLDLGNWETDAVEAYAGFLDRGVLYQDRPWAELFETDSGEAQSGELYTAPVPKPVVKPDSGSSSGESQPGEIVDDGSGWEEGSGSDWVEGG